jgi:hypothetical protein
VQLRDIFTIRPETACHSHDLLDCPCDRIETSGDNDAPSTAGAALEDDSRLTTDTTSGFVVASQVKIVDFPKLDKAVCALIFASRAEFSRKCVLSVLEEEKGGAGLTG